MTAAILLLAAAAGPALATGGDLSYPYEGWGVVARWHVGSASRRVTEGWTRREIKTAGWPLVKASAWLPAGPQGLVLRQTFTVRRSSWAEVTLTLSGDGVPEGTLAVVNGDPAPLPEAGSPLRLDPWLRGGTNVVALVYPATGAASAHPPVAVVRGLGAESGRWRTVATLKTWRVRADEVAADLPADMLRSAEVGRWRTVASAPPTAGGSDLPALPTVLKAVLDVPAFWRGRPLTLFLHGLPGTPAVWLNGERVAEAVTCPARLDLGGRLKLNGRDTLCLVYPSPPAAGADGGRWGVAALHWEAGVPLPQRPAGTAVTVATPDGPAPAGVDRALLTAAELLGLGATPFALSLTATAGGEVVAASWSATPFTSAGNAAARDRMAEWIAARPAADRGHVWVLTQPPAGRSLSSGANERLRVASKTLTDAARASGVHVISVFDVFKSALHRGRRVPARLDLTDDAGNLTAQGSFLLAVLMLEEFHLR